jgi:hypothetical protein
MTAQGWHQPEERSRTGKHVADGVYDRSRLLALLLPRAWAGTRTAELANLEAELRELALRGLDMLDEQANVRAVEIRDGAIVAHVLR